MDASGGMDHEGMGCVFNDEWTAAAWNKDFILHCDPGIKFLELFALCSGILIWARHFVNSQIEVFYDNKAVINMVNDTTSGCHNCMHLMRILVKTFCDLISEYLESMFPRKTMT